MSETDQTVNVIGDIAGNFKTFQALIAKMPKGRIVSVGDVIDRGPRSKECVDWFRENLDKSVMLRGNHEDFAIQVNRQNGVYRDSSWTDQGGKQTLASFGGKIPDDYLTFLTTRKYFLRFKLGEKRYFVSHAFAHDADNLDLSTEDKKRLFIWNRRAPNPSERYFLQIAGHNSHMGLRWFSEDNQRYAVCIDTSASGVLTGISLPSGLIYSQPYID